MLHITARPYYTRNVLIQFLIALTLVAVIIFWRKDFFLQIYFENQVSSVGWTINGGILLLFFAGLFRVVSLLLRYSQEENSLNRFSRNLAIEEDPLDRVEENSMVALRYETIKMLHRKRASINHSALAATLLANEASHNSFPKFVHNTLILTGVFGTIVSLSIALLGASDMVDNAQTNSIGTVIHGMSTALSTTMTAIITYLFFGYFYLKLTDAQTYLISRVEEVTATHLMPHFQLSQDALQKEYADSVTSASSLIKRFDRTQNSYGLAANEMRKAVVSLQKTLERNLANSQRTNQQLEKLVSLVEIGSAPNSHSMKKPSPLK